MSIRLACTPRRFWFHFAPSLILLAIPLSPAAAQVEVSLQGGVHAAELGRPERSVIDAAAGISIEGTNGEATTFGLRLGKWLSDRWGVDGGVALSRNRSWQGSVSIPTGPRIASDFQTQTLFSSATLRARITAPNSRWRLVVGAGPAVIFHRGSGNSLLARNTDLGGLVDVGGGVRLSSRLAFTLDAQQYLFSSRFAEPYAGQFVGDPVRPAGSQFRHEVVILAGVSWRAD